MNDNFEEKLLQGWEEVHKKSQLTFWILLSLKDGPKHMSDMKSFMAAKTNGLVEADDKSMYRALRRFTDVDIVSFSLEQNQNGPDRKVYQLTEAGLRVLNSFTKRNIIDVYYKSDIKKLLTTE